MDAIPTEYAILTLLAVLRIIGQECEVLAYAALSEVLKRLNLFLVRDQLVIVEHVDLLRSFPLFVLVLALLNLK